MRRATGDAPAVGSCQKSGFAAFLKRLRFAHRTICPQGADKSHVRCAQSVFSDAPVVRKNDPVHFAPAGAKACGAFDTVGRRTHRPPPLKS